MAKIENITNTSWLQTFKDRKKEMKLWRIPNTVAEYCNIKDGTRRMINIKFEDKLKINITEHFTITSGREIYFPKAFRDQVEPIIRENPKSFFTAKIIIPRTGKKYEKR